MSTFPLEIDFFQDLNKIMYKKRNLDPTSADFQFFLVNSTYLNGALLKGYLDHTLNATQEQVLKYKITNTLWGLKFNSEEIDSLSLEIFEIAKKITVRSGKNFEIFYKD